jgi:hypothetical protein
MLAEAHTQLFSKMQKWFLEVIPEALYEYINQSNA